MKNYCMFCFLTLTLGMGGTSCWADWVQDGGYLNINPGIHAAFPSLAIFNGTPYVTWQENNGTSFQIYAKHYAGSNWVQDGGSLNINPGADSEGSCIAISNGTPYVVWWESAGITKVYVKHWNGASWVQNGNSELNVTGQSAQNPFISTSNGGQFVTWAESNQIYFKHWDGNNWVQDGGSLNVNINNVAQTSCIALTNDMPYVAWAENNGTAFQIYVKHGTISGWTQDGSSLNVNNLDEGISPSIAFNNTTPYVAWSEFNGVAKQINVKYFNGSAWVQNGNCLNIDPTKDADNPKLAIANGIPYVAWQESNGTINQIHVKHWNGSDWVQDGSSLNVSPNYDAKYPSLAISNGIPYVAWQEKNATIYQVYVKHWVAPPATATCTISPTSTPTLTPTLTSTSPLFSPNIDKQFRVLHSQINPLKGEHARIYWYQFTDASTTIKIYNMIGDLILTVANNENFTSGQIHELPWNGRNTRGNIVGSGIYLVTIQSGDYKAWTKTAVVK